VTPEEKQWYRMGWDARNTHKPKDPPGWLDMRARHWWLAGWNDLDLQTNRIIDGFENYTDLEV